MARNSLTALSDAAELQNKRNRLKSILDSWKEHPGRAPNGTGETGLLSTDKEGYSQMLNEQTEAMNLANELSGDNPVEVRTAPLREAHFDSSGYVPNNPDYQEASFWNPYSVDEYRRRGSLSALQRLIS